MPEEAKTETIMLLLGLLEEALPIALRRITDEPLGTQMDFWYSFFELEKSTDLSGGSRDIEAIKDKLNDWFQVADARRSQPNGPLVVNRSETEDHSDTFHSPL